MILLVLRWRMLLRIAPPERQELEARVRSRTIRAEDARRARLILLLAKGEPYTAIQVALDCPATYVSRWGKRFEELRLDGLRSRHKGSPVRVLISQLEAKILSWTRRKPPTGRPTGAHGDWPRLWASTTCW